MKTFNGLLLFLFLASCATHKPSEESIEIPQIKAPSASIAHPLTNNYDLVMIDHGAFQVYYDPKIRSARYVKYMGLAQNMKPTSAHRRDKFSADYLLVRMGLSSVAPKEYVGSGYDRGHLAPAGDFGYDQSANDSTFVMSNMSPQKPKLNRQAWRLLEAQVRKWICGEERVKVITGPIFNDHPALLKSGLPIPVEYFKIVVDETPPRKVLGFIYSQNDDKAKVVERVVPIEVIELKSKINFQDELPAEIRTSLRQPSSIDGWTEKSCG